MVTKELFQIDGEQIINLAQVTNVVRRNNGSCEIFEIFVEVHHPNGNYEIPVSVDADQAQMVVSSLLEPEHKGGDY